MLLCFWCTLDALDIWYLSMCFLQVSFHSKQHTETFSNFIHALNISNICKVNLLCRVTVYPLYSDNFYTRSGTSPAHPSFSSGYTGRCSGWSSPVGENINQQSRASSYSAKPKQRAKILLYNKCPDKVRLKPTQPLKLKQPLKPKQPRPSTAPEAETAWSRNSLDRRQPLEPKQPLKPKQPPALSAQKIEPFWTCLQTIPPAFWTKWNC